MVSTTVRVFSALFTIALVAMVAIAATGFVFYNQYEGPGPLAEARTIVVPKGEGRIAIAERLEREGIIGNRWVFIGGHLVQMFFGAKKTQELKAGEYQIEAHASMRDVMETLADGRSILYKVTVPEGLTSEQVVERLKGDPNLTGDIKSIPEEGTLLPDTYAFSRGASRQEIIDRMQQEMTKTLNKMWEGRQPDLPLRSMQEALIFASIVEKETGRADERSRVAAVFHNRLKKGMRLQSDPTIIYGLTSGSGALGRSITRADIDAKTPYNTYQINGLPPGPIANPGKAAIAAALNPAKTDDLYFVADGSGGHAFSNTLKDHNSAVQKWRKIEKQNRESADRSPDPDTAPIPESDDPPPVKSSAKTSAKKAAAKTRQTVKAKTSSSASAESDGASAKKTKKQ